MKQKQNKLELIMNKKEKNMRMKTMNKEIRKIGHIQKQAMGPSQKQPRELQHNLEKTQIYNTTQSPHSHLSNPLQEISVLDLFANHKKKIAKQN